MRTSLRMLTVGAAAALLLGCVSGPAASKGADGPDRGRVLVFSKTAGFRHDSIPEGIAAVRELGTTGGFAVDATEDAGAFTARNLARYDAVVFLSTTGDVLDTTQQAAFERYIKQGGGYVGIHAAADTEYDWAFYGGLAGAYFQSHPAIQPRRSPSRTDPTRRPRSSRDPGSARTSGTTTARIRATGPTSSPRSTSPRTPAAR